MTQVQGKPGVELTRGDNAYLSIVIPAYNEQRRLGPTLTAIRGFLAEQAYAAEVLVVENGSTDGTYEAACEAARHWPTLRVLRERRRGKGLAVRRGMFEATGAWRFLCDADLSMPIAQLPRFLPPAVGEADIAIGSRELPASQVTDPARRRLIGRTFNRLVRRLVLPGLRDTQCGFKCFTAAAAECVFSRQRVEGFAFDVELLVIARRHGLRIAEVPITWVHNADSRVRVGVDALRMAAELLRIRRHARRGDYD